MYSYIIKCFSFSYNSVLDMCVCVCVCIFMCGYVYTYIVHKIISCMCSQLTLPSTASFLVFRCIALTYMQQ